MSQMGIVRPYGDTTGDGRVQVSFTLPVPFGDEAERARAEGAALQLAGKMGLDPAMVVHAKGMGPDFTFFIVYGRVSHVVDLSAITVAEREFPVLPAAEVNLRIRSALGRKLVVVGACIGTDAHTVGIDAILNVKGHAGEKGLEYYREIRVINMGAQVAVDDLVTRAAAEHADAVLVSQVVTQRDAHLSNIRDAHYGGNLVSGAYVLDLFGDVGTGAGRLGGDGARRADRRGHRDRDRGGAAARVLAAPPVSGYDVIAPKVVASMQRFKYQALVTPFADDGGDARSKLCSGSHRMVLRAKNSETHHSEVFQALVDCDDGGPFRAGSPQIMVTLRVVGDDLAEYLAIGSRFSLWSGHDLGRGVVTRRLLI